MRTVAPWSLTAATMVMLAAAPACGTEPATQLVVVIDSDLSVPDELDEVRIRVLGADGDLATDRVVRLGGGEGEFDLPADFGVAPRNAEEHTQVTIEVSPRLQGETLFVARAVTGFRTGHQLRLDMMLARRCIDDAAGCDAAQTCGTSGCGPATLDAATLPEFEP